MHRLWPELNGGPVPLALVIQRGDDPAFERQLKQMDLYGSTWN